MSSLSEKLLEQSALAVTYSEVGATSTDAEFPAGYKHDVQSHVIALNRPAYERVAEHVMTWGLQRSIGFRVHSTTERAADGATVLLRWPFLTAAARIIYVVDEPTRCGFAYGTLPIHPEIGEEYFGVSIDSVNVVRFEIRAFSRPGSLLARLGGPATRAAQLLATRRYVASARRAAGG